MLLQAASIVLTAFTFRVRLRSSQRLRTGRTTGDVAFTPAAPATGSGTAASLQVDTTTSRWWRGVYGSDSFNVTGNIAAYPSYATVTAPVTQLTSGRRRRQLLAPCRRPARPRIAACWYSSSSFQLDVA